MRQALQTGLAKPADADTAPTKSKNKIGIDLRKTLAVTVPELPPVLVDHTLQANGFDLTIKPAQLLEGDTLLDKLVGLLLEARKTAEEITSSPQCTGYIIARKQDDGPGTGDQRQGSERLLYEDFHPFVPTKYQNDASFKVLEFQGYNQTVDQFYSSLEGQKLESRLNEKEAAAKRRLEAVRRDQEKRLEGLQEAQTMNFRKAAAIEANVERVQEALDAVNGLLAQGMDWVDIGRLVEREKRRRNPVAETIALPLKLSENMISLVLAEESFDEDEVENEANLSDTDRESTDDEDDAATPLRNASDSPKGLLVDINLTLSPWSNAREYYEQRRSAVVKEGKTQLQAAKALKNTEQKINEDLKKGLKQEKALLQPIRRQAWFEKYLWFISSDGYLVLGGRDAQQNEMLYRRHLRRGDVYCHADLRGASSVIIKNLPGNSNAPIPPATLSQAGSMSVCSSDAWDSKASMGAWWVKADQVSKSSPAGDILPPGNFMIRGEKNLLPPTPLLLGIGILFRISDESTAKHVKHRWQGGVPAADADGAAAVRVGTERDIPEDESNLGTKTDDGRGDNPVNDGIKGPLSATLSSRELDEDLEPVSARENPLQWIGNSGDGATLEPPNQEQSELQVGNHDSTSSSVTKREDEELDAPAESSETANDDDTVTDASEAQTITSKTFSQTDSSATGKQGLPLKRGQRGKAKKMATKYKNQDEEDRSAAEALIGAAAGKVKAEAEAEAKAARLAELEATKERRRAQHERRQREAAEYEEARRVLMDEGTDMPDEDELESSAKGLDALVGTPLAGDVVLEAMPVCAPWNALGRFKYKAKMQPGGTKKGKATREVWERWKAEAMKKGAVDETATDREKVWPRELELIKGLRPEEMINCVPVGKLTVIMPGGGGNAGKGSKGGGRGQAKGARGGKGSKK